MFYCGFRCDKCGIAYEYEDWVPGITNLTRFARKRGWSVGKEVLCPNCRREKRKGDM